MLDTFRTMAGSLWAKVLLVLLVVSFAVWGVGDMLRAPNGNRNVATVGSIGISAREFQRELRKETENVRSAMGENYSPEAIKSLGLPPQVLQKLVSRKLMVLESQSLGLVPDDASIVARVRENPSFQTKDGKFDKRQFDATLQNAGLSENAYLDQLREDMATGLLIDTLLAKPPVSDTAARTLLAAREEQRQVAIYTLAPSLVGDIAAPNDADLKNYYSAHAPEFTAPEYRSVSYIVVTPDDLHKKAAVNDAEVQASYKERLDEFKRPERRGVEQLLYPAQDVAQKAADMMKSGKSTADVAKAFPPLNKDAIPLGKVEHSKILENASGDVFALKAGENTAPIQSPFGWHVFRVTSIDPPSTAPFEEVKANIEKDLAQRKADDVQNKLANTIEDQLAGGSTLKEVADGQGLKVLPAGTFARNGTSPDGSKDVTLPDLDKFVDTAFKTDEKTESSLIPAKGGRYYLLRVDSVTQERLRPLAEVKTQVVSGWQKEQRGKKLAALATTIAKSFGDKRADTIAKYHLSPADATVRHDSKTAANIALPPQLVDEVFSHKAGDATGASALDNGSYALAVVEKIIPAPAPESDPKLMAKLEQMRRSLEQNVSNDLLNEYTHYLMKKYTVSVNSAALMSVSN